MAIHNVCVQRKSGEKHCRHCMKLQTGRIIIFSAAIHVEKAFSMFSVIDT